MANSPQEVLVECRQHDVKAVALNVTDILGKWHRLTIPVSRLNEESFEDGFPWTHHGLGEQRGEVTDVLLMPQPETAYIQPAGEPLTLSLLCTMHDPLTREELPSDPRTIAIKAEKFARENGVADEVLFALALEFFFFTAHPLQTRSWESRRPRIRDGLNGDGLEQGSMPRNWSSGGMDDDFLNDAMQALTECGVPVTSHCQSGVDRHKSQLVLSDSTLVASADNIMITKDVIRRLALRWGRSATFMPLPQLGREPASMLTQMSLIKHESCALSGSGYAGLSDSGLHAIGGILRHAGAITALVNSTTNSYARAALGLGGSPWVAYSQSDLRAALRVPSHRASKHKCLEMRLPDAVSNPYLGLAALVMAAVDGVQNKIHPGPALDPDPYDTTGTPATNYQRVPLSLESALQSLQDDGEFLLRSEVFTPELLESWISHKRVVDIQALRSQPHPHEIAAYYDA